MGTCPTLTSLHCRAKNRGGAKPCPWPVACPTYRGEGTRVARVSRLETRLSAANCGLVMFDTLNGYLHPKDPEKQKFLAERNILTNMQRLLAGARKVGMTSFYPSGSHAADGSDTVSRLTDTDMDLNPKATKPIQPPFFKDHAASGI